MESHELSNGIADLNGVLNASRALKTIAVASSYGRRDKEADRRVGDRLASDRRHVKIVKIDWCSELSAVFRSDMLEAQRFCLGFIDNRGRPRQTSATLMTQKIEHWSSLWLAKASRALA